MGSTMTTTDAVGLHETLLTRVTAVEKWARAAEREWLGPVELARDHAMGPAEAEYYARVAPRAILRDTAATRALLELHTPREADWHPGVWICNHCDSLCHSQSGLYCGNPDAVYPCETIRALAAPHPETPEILEP
jgi:hypothetical protein